MDMRADIVFQRLQGSIGPFDFPPSVTMSLLTESADGITTSAIKVASQRRSVGYAICSKLIPATEAFIAVMLS